MRLACGVSSAKDWSRAPISMTSTSAPTAIFAIAGMSIRIVVMPGVTTEDQIRSSKPVTLTLSGTDMPACCNSVRARSAARSEMAAKAVNPCLTFSASPSMQPAPCSASIFSIHMTPVVTLASNADFRPPMRSFWTLEAGLLPSNMILRCPSSYRCCATCTPPCQ